MDKLALKLALAGTVVVMLVTLALYWPGLSGDFVLDDSVNIVKTWVEDPDLDSLKYSLTHNTSGPLGRGVSVLSFILTGLQYGIDPWGYKFHNLLLHLANGLLLFCLLNRLLRWLQPALEPRRVLLVAGLTCTFWLLHPLLVSTVLYAVQRMTQLAVFFTLLALLCHAGLRRCETLNLRFVLLGWVLFPLCLLLALMSKETGVLIPLYVLIIEVFACRTTAPVLRQRRHLALWLGTFVLLPLLVGTVGTLLFFDDIANYSSRAFTLGERLLTQLHVMVFYVRLILLPRLSSMGLYQDDFPVTTGFDLPTVLLALVWLAVVVGTWLLRKRLPVLAFGMAFFIVSHLLESTFVPLELVFEHRNYLAAAGLLLPPVYYLLALPPQVELKPLRWLLVPVAAMLVFLTFSRVKEWSSQEMLVNIAIQEHPQSLRAAIDYANLLLETGRNDEAIAQLRRAGELDPTDPGPLLHVVFIQCLQGKRDTQLLEQAQGMLRTRAATVYVLSALDALVARQANGRCTAVTLADAARLVDAALAQERNLQSAETHGYLLRFKGVNAFLAKEYVAGVVALRMAHEISGVTTLLSDLFRFQLAFGQVGDASDTLDYLKELNSRSFGIDDHLVQELEPQLTQARAGQVPSLEQALQGQAAVAE